jgi:hypothetical protein
MEVLTVVTNCQWRLIFLDSLLCGEITNGEGRGEWISIYDKESRTNFFRAENSSHTSHEEMFQWRSSRLLLLFHLSSSPSSSSSQLTSAKPLSRHTPHDDQEAVFTTAA